MGTPGPWSRREFWRAAVSAEIAGRAVRVSALIGTLLLAINQGDRLLAGELPPLWKVLLTYAVPFGVSSYSAAAYRVRERR